MMAELTPLVGRAAWFSGPGDNTDVVISSRVRLSRNLADFQYPGAPDAHEDSETNARSAADHVAETVRAELMPDVFGAESLEVEPAHMEDSARGLLTERRLVHDPVPRRLFVTADESVVVSVGTQDHLRIAAVAPGVQAVSALEIVRSIDKTLERHLNYAVSLDLGYLSSSILNLGSAMRVSAIAHLPALSRVGRVDEIQRTVRASDFDLIPDEQLTPDDGESALFRLCNHRTLGLEEDALAAKLEDHAQALLHYERLAREELLKDGASALTDEAYRALGVLRHARQLSADESLTLLNTLRLGVVCELVSDVTVETATALFFLSRENHVRAAMQLAGETGEDGEENIQLARANLIREALAG